VGEPFGNLFATIITPLGVLFIDSDQGPAWFGQPLT
jgi:hypothetical protein